MTFKHLFYLATAAWALLWLFSLGIIGGLMGDSLPILLAFLGAATVPPLVLYFLLFRVLHRIVNRRKKNQSTSV
jgi:hypothetical protein